MEHLKSKFSNELSSDKFRTPSRRGVKVPARLERDFSTKTKKRLHLTKSRSRQATHVRKGVVKVSKSPSSVPTSIAATTPSQDDDRRCIPESRMYLELAQKLLIMQPTQSDLSSSAMEAKSSSEVSSRTAIGLPSQASLPEPNLVPSVDSRRVSPQQSSSESSPAAFVSCDGSAGSSKQVLPTPRAPPKL
ncbi:Protein of unknown function, partial [Gryllus bimaculatus]